jgi:hypothetical protein
VPVNLLAICRTENGSTLKHVRVTAEVQNQLEGIFIQQEQEFLDGITQEIVFDGGWTPEANELLYADLTPEAVGIQELAFGNVTALDVVDAQNFRQEGIKALVVPVTLNGNKRLLLQSFTAMQLLDQRFNLFLDGDTFSRLNNPGFTIGTSLSGIVSNNRIKFRQYQKIKRIFDLANLYKEATDAQLDEFCTSARLQVTDSESFKSFSDQRMRKLVNAISQNQTLETYTAQQIALAAIQTGFSVNVEHDKIVMPNIKTDAKALLHFLDDGLYRSSLTQEMFITNSKRKLSQ